MVNAAVICQSCAPVMRWSAVIRLTRERRGPCIQMCTPSALSLNEGTVMNRHLLLCPLVALSTCRCSRMSYQTTKVLFCFLLLLVYLLLRFL
jgi:hypothetical protein